MTKYKIWNNKKYFLLQGRYVGRHVRLSHDVWNFYNSNNKIIKGDGNVIHHINGNKQDDNIENLKKLTFGEHSTLHNKERIISDETKYKMDSANRGKTFTKERKENMSKAHLGKHHSEITKLKMSVSRRFGILIKRLNKMEDVLNE